MHEINTLSQIFISLVGWISFSIERDCFFIIFQYFYQYLDLKSWRNLPSASKQNPYISSQIHAFFYFRNEPIHKLISELTKIKSQAQKDAHVKPFVLSNKWNFSMNLHSMNLQICIFMKKGRNIFFLIKWFQNWQYCVILLSNG